MVISVHRPVGVMDAAVVAQGDVTPFPSAAVSMNAPYHAMGEIQAGGDDLATEDEDGNRPVHIIRLFQIFMTGDAAGATTEPRIADHPVFSTKFILDSGATTHATGNRSLFPWLFPVQEGGEIIAANGHGLAVRGFGPVVMENFRLNGVLYVPGLSCNVISLSKLIELDYGVAFSRAGCLIKDLRTGEIVGNASLVRGLYHFDRLEIPLDRAPAVAP
ncbi:hypothetical protein SETIT_8G233100v2 [Setaria italica]|uniref:Retrovirus-related Pol polyprotein from transposon TNT 1-94-like beta-barrel domain-containing protein n=1 Tax=Setaria italica TaxID=4555 RepID=A0A368SAS1_SETIT|nr:uncharacterized protein LOC101760098 [Setaria italica]RCV39545.1 hypothetical protein SETIT_8G233100v2 [Setaria italica]